MRNYSHYNKLNKNYNLMLKDLLPYIGGWEKNFTKLDRKELNKEWGWPWIFKNQ